MKGNEDSVTSDSNDELTNYVTDLDVPDFSKIGSYLNMHLSPEEAMDYVFRSPFWIFEKEENFTMLTKDQILILKQNRLKINMQRFWKVVKKIMESPKEEIDRQINENKNI